jgi:hypothetical protein
LTKQGIETEVIRYKTNRRRKKRKMGRWIHTITFTATHATRNWKASSDDLDTRQMTSFGISKRLRVPSKCDDSPHMLVCALHTPDISTYPFNFVPIFVLVSNLYPQSLISLNHKNWILFYETKHQSRAKNK